MINSRLPVGVFPSVALAHGRGWIAVREGDPRQPGAMVVYEWTGADVVATREIARFPLAAGSPAFPALYVLDGLLWLAYHDGTHAVLRNLTAGSPARSFDALSNPMAFGGGCFAYTEPAQPYRVFRLDLRSGEVTQRRLGAPTGLSRILEDGSIVTIDEDRFALAGATIPSFAGDLIVGEGHSGGVDWTLGPIRGALWGPLDSFTPKCAADGARLAIATAGSGSVRLFCGSVADLVDASKPPVVEPPVVTVPPVVPSPQPQPEPPTMTVPNKSAELAAFHHQWNGGQRITDDAEKHRFTAAFAGTLGNRFGRKSRPGNSPLSKDTLGYWLGPTVPTVPTDGKIDAVDIISSSGDVSWDTRAEQGDPGYKNTDGRWYPVAQASAPAPGPSTPAPAPAVDLSGILARLAALESTSVRYGDPVGLRTDNGHFVCAEDGGGADVNATRTAPGGWEIFHVVKP